MKEKKSLDDIDTLLKDLSHQEKSILVDVQNLQNLDVDWRSSTAKVCGFPSVQIFESFFPSVLEVYICVCLLKKELYYSCIICWMMTDCCYT